MLARQFVLARLTKIESVDLNHFRFDYDLTWSCFFINADLTIYGRYGGRDASGPDARNSLEGLAYAMKRALDRHAAVPKFIDPLPRSKPFMVRDFKAYASHGTGCVHCHNIKEMERADLKALGTWSRDDVYAYPLPDNVGIILETDRGDMVRHIGPNSAAEKVGLQSGDRITTLANHPIASFADASFALDTWKSGKPMPVAWIRGETTHSAMLALARDWRQTNITWRPSLLDLLPAVPFAPVELTENERLQLGIAAGQAVFRQGNRVHPSLMASGLLAGDVVVSIGGKPIQGTSDDLLGNVRRRHLKGETVSVNVLRSGRPVELKLLLR